MILESNVKDVTAEMKITDNNEEMIAFGRQLVTEQPELYSEAYMQLLERKYSPFFNNKDEYYDAVYSAIYCQYVYGTSILEYGTYNFKQKTHEEKTQYITWDSRFLYMAFLNKDSFKHILDNKFEAYEFLKPFYKRDAMLLSDEKDYDVFYSFVKKHPAVFVKPNNLELTEGVHRLEYDENDDLKNIFDTLLKEAAELSSTEVKREIDHRLILEELISPSEFIRQINPNEMSLLRVTTINIKGNVHFFYPCLRLLLGNGKDEVGEDYSCVALIDSETGEVVTNGKSSFGDFDINPVTGQKIQGMFMPEWSDLKNMLTEAAEMLPEIRYIGWDVTHTDKGWCIIEGNPNGEFFYQMCLDHGVKEEFENLIGLKVPYDFWKSPLFRKKGNHTK